MRRRAFLTFLIGAAVLRRIALAQQTTVPLVGVLVVGNQGGGPIHKLQAGLHDLGYVEGRNIHIEVRSADGDVARLPTLATELVQLRVDVLVTWFTPEVLAAKRATAEIPIVMMGAGDPVGMGIIASLGRPGGNVTGISGFGDLLAGKNVEILRELLPNVRRIAALCNSADPFGQVFLKNMQLAGTAQNIVVLPFLVTEGASLDAAFPAMVSEQAEAVIVQGSLTSKHTAALALNHRLPSVSITSVYPGSGGLMAYSNDPADIYRHAAVYVDKILKGAKPSDLPVEQATKFRLSINLRTAKALGLKVPQSVLARADEVIE